MTGDQGAIGRGAWAVAGSGAVIRLAVGRFIRRPGDRCGGIGNVGSGNVRYEGWAGSIIDVLDLGGGHRAVVNTNVVDRSFEWVCPDCFSGIADGFIHAAACSLLEGDVVCSFEEL